MTTNSNSHGLDSTLLPEGFVNLLGNSSHSQKKAMLIAIQNSLNSDKTNNNQSATIDFNQYVELVKDFVPDNFLDDALIAEVTSMGLCKKSAKPLTQWLSVDDRPYCFSDNPNSRHESRNLNDFPAINKLMEIVNSDTRTTQDANAALVIVYNSNNAAIGFHDDNETILDSKSSISTVTFGSSRTVEFCNSSLRPRTAQHSVECANHDMMVMKAGCQSTLVHRVMRGTNETVSPASDTRIVISFRKVVHVTNPDSDPELSINLGQPSGTPGSSTGQATNVESVSSLSNGVCGVSLPQRVSIIAGDSHIVGLDVDRLGRKGRKTVINLAKGGATISQVEEQIESYFISCSDANQTPIVDKIIVCVGTNDIRHCKENGVGHLKRPLSILMEKIKLMFPDCIVFFQSLIPLIIQNQFTIPNVNKFNRLLFDLCSHMRVFFVNVFSYFIQFDCEKRGLFRNENLFVNSKNIHLNKFGLSILARSYIKIIHSNRFNPLGY